MEDLQVITSAGAQGQLAGAAIGELKTSMRGPVLCAGDEGYEEARQVWNGLIDRHPALVARCTGVADLIDAVNFARTHNLLVSVRGGGHNVAGSAVCDGGLMIDPRWGNHWSPRRRLTVAG
ncbi:MAG: FAD-binding protein [Caldilineaceae bacterium]